MNANEAMIPEAPITLMKFDVVRKIYVVSLISAGLPDKNISC